MQRIKQIPGWVWLVLAVAVVWRTVLLSSNAVSFHADEAVVGLMARHINQGKDIPTFFYGQAYMGSLDALWTAFIFCFTGETVAGLRLGQSLLYVATLLVVIGLALRLSRGQKDRAHIGLIAGLLFAVPSVTLTLYTTATLGGYGETLLIGNLMLLVTYEIRYGKLRRPMRAWAALGALAGLGWWTNNLIAVYALPVALILLRGMKAGEWRFLGYAALTFMIFSLPWWLYNLRNDWASIRFLLEGYSADADAPRSTLGDRLLGFLLIGLPALFGVRWPWSPDYWPGQIEALAVLVVYLALLVRGLGMALRQTDAARYLWAVVGGFIALFLLSSFGTDSTGRYLIPLIAPITLLLALELGRWRSRLLAYALVLALIAVNVAGTAAAVRDHPTGLTTQADPSTDISNAYDTLVLDFLSGRDGYATYWVAYRLAFLSHEEVILP